MQFSLERELDLHAEEEILVPKDEPQEVEQPHAKYHGVAENTHAKPSIINGRRHSIETNRLRLDATENVGAPISHHR